MVLSMRLLRPLCALFVSTGLLAAAPAEAKSKKVINAEVSEALKRLKEEVPASRKLLRKAKGVLVFPTVIKAGFGIGGEYGEGALRVGNKTVAYYSTASASVGLQAGAQAKTVVIIFLKKDALKQFRKSDGWEVGVDGSVALIEVGAAGELSTTNYKDPIVGFVFNNKGLMANLTIEGTKISKIDR